MKIYDEHMNAQGQHKRFEQLKAQDYNPEYEAYHTVPSSSKDHAYLVAKVACLNVPFDEADVAEDMVTIYLCSCPAYHYQESAGFEDGDMQPAELGKCKHIISEFKHLKAQEDDQQTSL